MSNCNDERPHRASRRARGSDYADDTTYSPRGETVREMKQTSLVRRRNDSPDSVEEID